jgi:hypothetical protein
MQLRRKAQLYGEVIKCGVNLNKSGNRMAPTFGMAAPPSYGDRAFWDTRFLTETHFEWLGAGGPLVTHIQEHLERAAKSDGSSLPKTLHIGAGTSVLHEHILHIYQRLYPSVDEIAVVNTDYSAEAVTKGARTMRQDMAWPTSAWETSDALSWVDVRDLAQKYGTAGAGLQTFKLVVDKSTSDAISCHEDIEIGHADRPDAETTLHPLLINLDSPIDPLQLLALHLAAIVRPGGVWLALSYSANRFPFLENGGTDKEPDMVGASRWWRVEAVDPIEVPSAANKHGVHAPTIMHHLYRLRRTDEPV